MAPHTPNLLLEDSMVEPGLELSTSSRSGGHTSCVLTTSHNNIRLRGRDTSTVQRRLGCEGLDDLKVFRVVELIKRKDDQNGVRGA